MSKEITGTKNTNETAEISRRNLGISGRARQSSRSVRIKCQICATETIPGVDLGNQPIGDLVISQAQLNQPETFYLKTRNRRTRAISLRGTITKRLCRNFVSAVLEGEILLP